MTANARALEVGRALDGLRAAFAARLGVDPPYGTADLLAALELVAAEAHEIQCPQCGATIRARMADQPETTT